MNTISHTPSIRRKPFLTNLVTVAVSSFLVFGRRHVQISAQTPNTQYEVRRDISQYLHPSAGLTLQLRHNFLLRYPFEFVMHQ
jgi:hypothetical protein